MQSCYDKCSQLACHDSCISRHQAHPSDCRLNKNASKPVAIDALILPVTPRLHEGMPEAMNRDLFMNNHKEQTHLSRIVSRPVLADAPSCLSHALRDRLSSCETMVTFLRLLMACANQLFPAPATTEGGETLRP